MRNRLRVVAALVVALHALVAETSVLRHHDVACSPKAAGGQCEACLRGPEVSRVEAAVGLDQPVLLELGDVEHCFEGSPRSGRALPHVGRAPPA